MASLKVFFDMMSQPSRSVILLLKANKVPFTPRLINIAKGMHFSDEEFAKVNPNKRVPAIQDGDFKLFECTAIMKYICNKYNLPDHWYPADLKKRSKVDEYLSWHHTNTRLAAFDIIWGKVLAPRLMGKPVNEKRIQKGQKQMAACMAIYDGHFLKDTPFISSHEITIADVFAVCEFSQLEILPPDFVELSQKVNEWITRCKESFGSDYHDVHSILYKAKAAFNETSKL